MPALIPTLCPQRIHSGRYVVEILLGGNGEQFWYYIVQRVGSSRIIDLAKCQSQPEALKQAQNIMDRLNNSIWEEAAD
jgi:tRNA/tmRNA/rRNA uracil-C5-methylase (TrmA/RlmC/RlmD family)